MERQITISIEEYNKLIDMHTRREELPKKIEVKKFTSKWWRWIKHASYSLFHYNKNVEQQKLIKYCINEMSSELLANLYGYWRGDLSDYLKKRDNLEYFMRSYKDNAYHNIMEWLDKKKQRMKELNVKLRVNMLILEIESALNISDSKFINAEHVLSQLRIIKEELEQ